ncbi:Dothistromin biosynthesis peroxidase dotB [Fulvia fulva]|uniref:Dothistromin biosynthesis peroxidase dotB n=1 Tax=Passalora fulva TaxID=5499 RepID=A0A9Q8PMG6_PASFU|nr:Dothistromin biosynthesis peroxidase dotB [Fulvia fulva]UJO25087.1 Dothistromin biosynthesis peroxidase dotB [Fulvia fulva]WPV22794.1 Dothistromin biosynthesis peroxidase dotB [Fulvia fulva]
MSCWVLLPMPSQHQRWGSCRTLERMAVSKRAIDPTKPVPVTGDHAYQPANFAAGEIRGLCPGLNALANHGYLPRSGVGTIEDFSAITDVFGVDIPLAQFLAVYGAVFDGDLLSWSIIGGPPPDSLVGGLLGGTGLIGKPQGLSGSHNKYEGDASPTRGDLYVTGNNFRSLPENFQALYDMQKDVVNPNYDLTVLGHHRSNRFENSIATNPYFFNASVPGLAVLPAAYSFICRLRANHTGADPQEGTLDKETLKASFGYPGPDDKLVHTPGTERIPENCGGRRRPLFRFHQPDIPFRWTGEVNTFTGVNVGDLSGGVFNGQTLAEGNNAWCFAMQFAAGTAPDVLKPLFGALDKPISMIRAVTGQASSVLGCPQLQATDDSQFDQFPGSAKLSSKGTY